MDDRETLVKKLMLAEQQFRLACTVNLAVANNVQTLDVPVEWTFGKHRVSYEDFGLRPDQACGRGSVQDHLQRSTYIYKTAGGGLVGWHA
jgi:hypothetical protein